MSRNRFRGSWREIQGKLKAGWADLVKDELGRIYADVQTVSGLVEKSYDLTPDEARPHAEAFVWGVLQASWSKQLARDWDEGKQRITARWDRLGVDDLKAIDGRSEDLLASIERAYDIEDWQAASEMLSFFRDWREESS